MSDSLERSLSSLSLDSQPEDDWDRSLLDPEPSTPIDVQPEQPHHTPRNSVVFPAEDTPGRSSRYSSSSHSRNGSVDGMGKSEGKRTLSDLLRLHSEKGCNGRFSADEASRIADVLGQWVRRNLCSFSIGYSFMSRLTRLPRLMKLKTTFFHALNPRMTFRSPRRGPFQYK